MEKDVDGALRAIADMMARGEKAQAKFAPGTAQHTLQKNRLQALCVAATLIEVSANATAHGVPKDTLEHARAPLVSLISKSEKAQTKVKDDTWQYAMLERNLSALRIALPLLEDALQKPEEAGR